MAAPLRLSCPACRALAPDGDLLVGELDADGVCGRCARRHPRVRAGGAALEVILRADDHDARAMAERALAWATSGPSGAPGPEAPERPWALSALSWTASDWGPYLAAAPRARAMPWLDDDLAASVPADGRVAHTAILGAGACGVAFDLARCGEPLGGSVAIDASPWGLAVAAAIAAGARSLPVLLDPQAVGWRALRLDPGASAAFATLRFIVGDALDPPLMADAVDRVIALNLLDTVVDPALLLAQIHGILRPGGRALLTSPWCMTEAITPRPAWPGAAAGSGDPFAPNARPLAFADARRWIEGSPAGDWHFRCVAASTGSPWRVAVHARMEARYRVDRFVVEKPQA